MAKNKETRTAPRGSNPEGAQLLYSRIVDEARREAEATVAAAHERAEQIRAETEVTCAQIAMEGETTAQRSDNEILSRSRTQAELEAKKHALKGRYAVLDDVFAAAYNRILALDTRDTGLVRLMYKLMVRESRGGETICPSERHYDTVRAAFGKANEKLASLDRTSLTMGRIYPGIEGGFMLIGPNYRKDCSLRAVLAEERELRITEVANLLFAAGEAAVKAETEKLAE